VDDIEELTIESALPDVNSVIIQQGQSQSFFISAKAPVGRTLTMVWTKGSTVVSTGTNYTITASLSNVGTETLSVKVSDGVISKTRSWTVKVNGPPTITPVTTGTPKVAVGSSINIVATATDPNSDLLTYTWKINGVTSSYLSGSTGTATLTGNDSIVGTINISLEVSDGSISVTQTWTAEVNYFPQACNTLATGQICTVSGSPSIGDSTQPGISNIDLKIKPISHSQDSLGNLFVADYLSNIIWYWNRTSSSVSRLGVTVPAYTIKVVAGSGETGANGADGVALESALNAPRSVYYHEATGKLYIAEYGSSRVRYVDNTGYIYTGMGGGSSQVDGNTAYNHGCSNPAGLAYYNDSIYVTCRGHHRTKRWDLSTDLAYTVVGDGGNSMGNGAATSTDAGYPHNIFVNSDGIYISHRERHRITFTNHSGSPKTFWSGGGTVTVPNGNVAVIAGTGTAGSDDNTNATAGKIGNPTGLVYLNNILFFTQLDNEYLYAINDSGAPTTISGITIGAGKMRRITNAGTYNGSGVALSSAKMYDPYEITIDVLNPTNQLIVSDYANNRVRRINLADEKLYDMLGSGKTRNGSYGDTPKPTQEHLFNYVTGVTYDNTNKKILFVDANNYKVRETDQYGRTQTAVSSGNGDPSSDNEVPSSSRLKVNWSSNWYLSVVDLMSDLSLIVSNPGSNNIRLWNRSGNAKSYYDVYIQDDRISNLAGDYLNPGNGGDGTATSISLQYSNSARYNPVDGKVYVLDKGNHCLRSLATDGTLTRVLGNCGTSGSSGADVVDSALEMNAPTDIGFDSVGNVIIADRGNHRIRYWNKSASAVTVGSVTISPNHVSIIACLNGSSASGSLNDGILATSARCSSPTGIAVNSTNICFTNMGYHDVRCISLAEDSTKGKIYTKAGTPPTSARAGSPYGFEQEGIAGTSATLYNPTGIAFDAAGDLYIADSQNHIVRKVKLSD
tara:strand:+ start:13183 stop:16062 length:2880 start_codon:yes stop_codon:yes gene_type:complete